MKLDIDFSQHPAFAGSLNTSNKAAGEYRKLMAELDGISSEIYGPQTKVATLAERWAQFDQRAQPLRKAFDKLIDADGGVEPRLIPHMKKGFRKAIKERAEDLELFMTRMKPWFSASSQVMADAEELHTKGFKTYQVSSRWLQPLQDFLREDIENLRRRISEGKGDLLFCEAGELPHAILRDFFHKAGVFDALGALYGVPFDKAGFCIHVSHPGDTWFRVYDDVGLPLSKTAQMHYDLAYNVPKAMVYMNDVGEDQGPFSLVPESHHWEDTGFWLSFRKQVTYALSDYAKEVGLPNQGANASGFRCTGVRKAFGSLPAELRATAHPGDHILDDTALSRDLLAKERQITGPAGTFGLFTGSHILHRGGIAKSGERWALQTCFYPKAKVKLPSKEELQKAGLASSAAPKKEPKRSFFGRLFGSSPAPVAKGVSEPVKAPAAAAAPAASGSKEPKAAYNVERFSEGMSKVLGQGTRLSVVDVGGALNLQPHWHRFQKVADYVVFEPHPKSYNDLVERQKSSLYYRNFRYINAALSGASGPRTLYKSNVPTGTSLLPPKKDGLGNYPGNTYLYPMTEEVIETTTLAESLGKAGVEVVHGIKLDTQGTELEILRGLGSALSKNLLVVEAEIGVIEHYDVPSATLEEAIPLLRSLGLELFDLRTNRCMGNVGRLKGGVNGFLEQLKTQRSSPSVAQRLNEVDAIFFRDPRTFIDQGADMESVRRLISMLCAYNFYGEAVFAVSYSLEKGLLDQPAHDALMDAVKALHIEARLEIAEWEQWLVAHQFKNWGQYMWVPYPSA